MKPGEREFQKTTVTLSWSVTSKSWSPHSSVCFEFISKTRILNPTNWQMQEFRLFWHADSKWITINSLLSSLLVNQKHCQNCQWNYRSLWGVPQRQLLLSSSKHSKFPTKNSFWFILTFQTQFLKITFRRQQTEYSYHLTGRITNTASSMFWKSCPTTKKTLNFLPVAENEVDIATPDSKFTSFNL